VAGLLGGKKPPFPPEFRSFGNITSSIMFNQAVSKRQQ